MLESMYMWNRATRSCVSSYIFHKEEKNRKSSVEAFTHIYHIRQTKIVLVSQSRLCGMQEDSWYSRWVPRSHKLLHSLWSGRISRVALTVVKATRRLSNLVCSTRHMFQNVIKISSINIFCKRTVFEVCVEWRRLYAKMFW